MSLSHKYGETSFYIQNKLLFTFQIRVVDSTCVGKRHEITESKIQPNLDLHTYCLIKCNLI